MTGMCWTRRTSFSNSFNWCLRNSTPLGVEGISSAPYTEEGAVLVYWWLEMRCLLDQENYEYLVSGLSEVAVKHSEQVLHTPHNDISIGKWSTVWMCGIPGGPSLLLLTQRRDCCYMLNGLLSELHSKHMQLTTNIIPDTTHCCKVYS